MGGEQLAHGGELGLLQVEAPLAAQLVHARPDASAVPAGELEQKPLEIARKLNVHAWARGRDHVPRLVDPRGEGSGQTVVLVRGNNEAFDRQAHRLGRVTCENITEISGGHGEGHRPVGAAERDGRGEVVDDLREDPREVDGVDAGQRELFAQGLVGEQRLHQSLAIVEGAFDGDVVHVRLGRTRHLPPLHVRHPPLRMQDENVDHVEAAKGLDRRGAGVARGGADHGGARAAARQRPVHQPRNDLKREVLEGERRTVEQLEQPGRGPDLAERRHGGVMEAAIGLLQHRPEIGEAGIAFEIGTHDAIGGFGIIETGEACDLAPVEARPGFRHIEAAIAGETREKRAFKGKRRGLAPCAHIFQHRTSKSLGSLG